MNILVRNMEHETGKELLEKKKCSNGMSLSKLRTKRNKLRCDLRKAKKNGTDIRTIRENLRNFANYLVNITMKAKHDHGSCFNQKLRKTGKTAPNPSGGLPHRTWMKTII